MNYSSPPSLMLIHLRAIRRLFLYQGLLTSPCQYIYHLEFWLYVLPITKVPGALSNSKSTVSSQGKNLPWPLCAWPGVWVNTGTYYRGYLVVAARHWWEMGTGPWHCSPCMYWVSVFVLETVEDSTLGDGTPGTSTVGTQHSRVKLVI